jgi:hypothetical protein
MGCGLGQNRIASYEAIDELRKDRFTFPNPPNKPNYPNTARPGLSIPCPFLSSRGDERKGS